MLISSFISTAQIIQSFNFHALDGTGYILYNHVSWKVC